MLRLVHGIGLGVWLLRMYVFRVGRAYWTPFLEIVMGRGLADLMDRGISQSAWALIKLCILRKTA